MTDRVKMLKEALNVDKYRFCFEKAKITIESYKQNNGWPAIIKRARGTRDYLDRKTIFIEPGELIIGNVASKPMGLEILGDRPTWTDQELDELIEEGLVEVDEADRAVLHEINDFLLYKGSSLNEWKGLYYNDERLWAFRKKGYLSPPWTNRKDGIGNGFAGCGWGTDNGPQCLIVPRFEDWIYEGIGSRIEQAKQYLKDLRFYTREDIQKANFYYACLDVFPAIIRLAHRFADLAEDMAGKERDEKRRAELLQIAETCRWVPEHPARTFREGIQSFWFYWIMITTGTTPGGRFDQYMYPLYKADLEAGRITREEALELLECLRIKIMQFGLVYGGKLQRAKWAGMARWHNFIIGGCDRDGNDATNELSYLLLEAAKDTMTPHHTLTVRVSEKTPRDFLIKALEVVRTGIGMPAFISEDSYIKFITNSGVPIEDAREFAIAGCLDAQLPGRSRNLSTCMFIVPLVLELAFYNGHDPKTGELMGVECGEFEDFKTFDEFYKAFLAQMKVITGEVVEQFCILYEMQRLNCPDVVHSAFMDGGMESGIDCNTREMLFENGEYINCVGMISLSNSIAVIKKLVFEDKVISPAQLKAAIAADWAGYEDLQKLCKQFPKYGNNDEYTDSVAAMVWHDVAETIRSYKNLYGHPMMPSAISITAHAPGGALTGATPDGRFAGETFADGSTSPTQGTDVNGPLAVFMSAMRINQEEWYSTLMNMKFSPSALKSEADLGKLADMLRVYLTRGGKHVQFNVVDTETLKAAKVEKEKYRNLVVRVAGYSAYYTQLTDRVQNEIIERTEQEL